MTGYERTNRRFTRLPDEAFSRQARLRREAPPPTNFESITNHEYLLATYDKLRSNNGTAPGEDGLGFYDLSRSEIAEVLRSVSAALREQTYLPGPHRNVEIPRSDGSTRELHLRNIVDRVVSSAAMRTLDHVVDRTFLPCSTAYRPDRSVLDAFRAIEFSVMSENCSYFVQDDIRRAFDNVPIDAALEVCRRHVTDPGLIWLIETVLRGHETNNRTVGIDQGDPLSPVVLNLLLHYYLDLPLKAAGREYPRYVRYADNVVMLTDRELDGRQAIDTIRNLLAPIGMLLKGENGGPANLHRHGARVELLGYRISLENNRMWYEPGSGLKRKLREKLDGAWGSPDPSSAAANILRGTLQYLGPTIQSAGADRVIELMLEEAYHSGFREAVSRREMVAWAYGTLEAWYVRRGVSIS